jgi:hypothetical protein
MNKSLPSEAGEYIVEITHKSATDESKNVTLLGYLKIAGEVPYLEPVACYELEPNLDDSLARRYYLIRCITKVLYKINGTQIAPVQ